ncbi:sigma-70 family RNA polymerase sigma factor [Clostridium sp.]|uniref:sigma-70 family RNA polymerase sigma factor n=1 Tax=Clostridium sp. TaxID=1506 RepID=UPI003990F087
MRGELESLIRESKRGNRLSTEILLEKYKPLINKVAFHYYIKGYENDDLIQIASMWFLESLKKYDLEKKSDFSSYVMRALNNNMKALIRKMAKENYEKSINDNNGGTLSLEDTLVDDFNVVAYYERKERIERLRKAIDLLNEEEKEIIYFIYSKKSGNLSKLSRKNNIPYGILRKKRDKILKKLRNFLDY